MNRPGKMIVVEGPDGAGKTTLAGFLGDRVRESGREVVEVREPGGTPVAEAAREIFLDVGFETSDRSELFLVLAARADLVEKVILPALDDGKVVISDRFYQSTLAYQVAGRGLPEDEVRKALALATQGLEPDLTVVIDVTPEVGRRRQLAAGKELDRLERAPEGMHERVGEYFRLLAGSSIFRVDGGSSSDEVGAAAWGIVTRELGW